MLAFPSKYLFICDLPFRSHEARGFIQMAPRKGQKNRFPISTFFAIKRNVDEQLALALALNKEYNAKAKKLKRLEAKVQ